MARMMTGSEDMISDNDKGMSMENGNKTPAEQLSAGFKEIGIDCPAEIIAGWSLENMISDVQIDDVCTLLSSIRTLIDSRRATMLKNMSRIPQAARKTFGNFDMSRLSKGNDGLVRHLESLDFISLGENVVIVGDPGTGKTHIAGHRESLLRQADTCQILQGQRTGREDQEKHRVRIMRLAA